MRPESRGDPKRGEIFETNEPCGEVGEGGGCLLIPASGSLEIPGGGERWRALEGAVETPVGEGNGPTEIGGGEAAAAPSMAALAEAIPAAAAAS